MKRNADWVSAMPQVPNQPGVEAEARAEVSAGTMTAGVLQQRRESQRSSNGPAAIIHERRVAAPNGCDACSGHDLSQTEAGQPSTPRSRGQEKLTMPADDRAVWPTLPGWFVSIQQ